MGDHTDDSEIDTTVEFHMDDSQDTHERRQVKFDSDIILNLDGNSMYGHVEPNVLQHEEGDESSELLCFVVVFVAISTNGCVIKTPG